MNLQNNIERGLLKGAGAAEFNNQNGGSFMNKLFKATALASIAVASVIIISCSGSDGKGGANGPDGAAGKSCILNDNLDFLCDGEKVGSLVSPQGPQGATGVAGPGCDLQAVEGSRSWNVICDGELMGTIKDGEEGVQAFTCTLKDQGNDSLVVTCGSNSYVMSLCSGETFDEKKFFCGEYSVADAKVTFPQRIPQRIVWVNAPKTKYEPGIESYSYSDPGCSAANGPLAGCKVSGYSYSDPGCDEADAPLAGCKEVSGGYIKDNTATCDPYTGAGSLCGDPIEWEEFSPPADDDACTSESIPGCIVDDTWDGMGDPEDEFIKDNTATCDPYTGVGSLCGDPIEWEEFSPPADDDACTSLDIPGCISAGGTGTYETDETTCDATTGGLGGGAKDYCEVVGYTVDTDAKTTCESFGPESGFCEATYATCDPLTGPEGPGCEENDLTFPNYGDCDEVTGIPALHCKDSGTTVDDDRCDPDDDRTFGYCEDDPDGTPLMGDIITPQYTRVKRPLCNGEKYDPALQHCARNLIIGLTREYKGSQLENLHTDVDPRNSAVTGNLWKVLGRANGMAKSVDTCFVQATGVTSYNTAVIAPCNAFRVSTTAVKYDIAAYERNGTTTRQQKELTNVCSSTNGSDVDKTGFFNYTLGRCVTANDCSVIMSNSNACYAKDTLAAHAAATVATYQNSRWYGKDETCDGGKCLGAARPAPATPSANTNVFARKCYLLGEGINGSRKGDFFYDTKTITGCDENRADYELAIKCASGLYFSSVRHKTFTGNTYDARFICVSASNPTFCPTGSTNVGGICTISASAKVPVCPTGYVRGPAPAASEDEIDKDPRNYCVAEVTQAMCDSVKFDGKSLKGLLKPGTGEDRGSCVIATAGETLPTPTGYTKDDAQNRYVYTPATGTAGLCLNGYTYNATEKECVLTTKAPKCYAGYNVVKATINDTEGYYCTYTPQVKDCPPYHTLNDTYKKCLPSGTDDLAELKTPSCPYAQASGGTITFDADAKLCYEVLDGDKHCPVGSNIDLSGEEANECLIDSGSPVTCPSALLNSTFDEETGICSIGYIELCPNPFSYDEATKKCILGDSQDPVCPLMNPLQAGTVDADLQQCAILIGPEHCKLNIDNPKWTLGYTTNYYYHEITGKLLTDVSGQEIKPISIYVQENQENQTRVQECQFQSGQIGKTFGTVPVPLYYSSPMCNAKGDAPDSETGRCEQY